jgi:hypothetical protein
MQGSIPSQWANSTHWQESLVDLRLASSGLTSPLPTPWILNNITHLDLSNNSLSGDPSALFTEQLEHVDLSNNIGLTGSWQAVDWSAMSSLSVLQMSNVSFTGTFPTGGFDCLPGTSCTRTALLTRAVAASCAIKHKHRHVLGLHCACRSSDHASLDAGIAQEHGVLTGQLAISSGVSVCPLGTCTRTMALSYTCAALHLYHLLCVVISMQGCWTCPSASFTHPTAASPAPCQTGATAAQLPQCYSNSSWTATA